MLTAGLLSTLMLVAKDASSTYYNAVQEAGGVLGDDGQERGKEVCLSYDFGDGVKADRFASGAEGESRRSNPEVAVR